jgi:hypothetical protein
MNYLFKPEGKMPERIHGEFECFSCYESVTEATVYAGELTYTCKYDHDNILPWGEQGELEV